MDPKTIQQLLNQSIFAKNDLQLVTRAFCILVQKNGGTLEIPSKEIGEFQTQNLDYEIDNKEKVVRFKLKPVTVDGGVPNK
jgi:hypothetical protein